MLLNQIKEKLDDNLLASQNFVKSLDISNSAKDEPNKQQTSDNIFNPNKEGIQSFVEELDKAREDHISNKITKKDLYPQDNSIKIDNDTGVIQELNEKDELIEENAHIVDEKLKQPRMDDKVRFSKLNVEL